MEIKIFENALFGQVRTACADTEPLFCLVDVCRALGLKASKISQRLTSDVVSLYPIIDRLGRTQQANFVSEDGLYDVILDSHKASAKQFRKWVTSEVLPQIRKTGGYIPVSEGESDSEIMAKALLIAQRHIEMKDKLIAEKQKEIEEKTQDIENKQNEIEEKTQDIENKQKEIEEKTQDIENKQKQITTLEPLADYMEKALLSKSDKTLTQTAHALGLRSVYTLTSFLKARGYIQWQPTVKTSTKGYFSTRTFQYINTHGEQCSDIILTVTEKGRKFIYDELQKYNIDTINSLY